MFTCPCSSFCFVCSTASIFNLVLLSLDRYWAVVYPLRYLQKRTCQRAVIFILIVWFISLLWAPAIVFWSHIFPEYSDIIGQHECDTAFRSNKLFKTLTALINFYFPLLTMIIVSCRTMVAIHSRSKMKFGRRLSSATQKQMKRELSIKPRARKESSNKFKSNNTKSSPLSSTPIRNPLDLTVPDCRTTCNKINDNVIPTDQSNHYYFSPCQPYNATNSGSLRELQTTSMKKSLSSLRKRFSFAQMKPFSMIFLPTDNTKENKECKTRNSFRKTSDSIKSSPSVSNSMKLLAITSSNQHSDKYLSSSLQRTTTKQLTAIQRSIPKTISLESTFSDEYLETMSVSPAERQQVSKSIEEINKYVKQALSSNNISSYRLFRMKPETSNHSLPRNSYSEVTITPATENDSITAPTNNGLMDSLTNNTVKTNIFSFFNILINPSRSSSLQKELKAARQLGILVGVFTISWSPYFILFLVVAWCNRCIPDSIFIASIWLGYLNSSLNPVIYPLCNAHFRRVFQKICYCKQEKTKLPNIDALRELQALHGMRRQRR